MRLDLALVEKGLETTRTRAKNLIADSNVSVNGKVITKPSFEVDENDIIEIVGEKLKYVGRGGLKLEKALLEFSIDVTDYICIDIGASTGGFTDCLLQNGAKHVYAVDIGTLQLDEKLALDKRVTKLENTDARDLNGTIIPDECDFACFDVSFISLTKVVSFVLPFIKENGMLVVLIKPQFEAGRKNLSKKGIVTSQKVRDKVLEDLKLYFTTIGLKVIGVTESPIKGGDGNIEYLMALAK